MIRIRNIEEIKHNIYNNYLSIVCEKDSDETFETFKKEEIILFISKKFRKIGKKLRLVDLNKLKGNMLAKSMLFNP